MLISVSDMPKSRLIIIGSVGLIVIFFTLLFLGVIPGLRDDSGRGEPVKLNVWGVFDSRDVIAEAARAIPGYEVNYRELNAQTYESELVNALAAGRGPDIFMIHSSWLPKHIDKLTPVSEVQLPLASFQALYPTVAEQDFAPDRLIYALPLYIDTLALFWNRDIFDSAGIALPPQNWIEFQNLVPKLRQLDATGKLTRAAAAIGGSNKNINRGSDLLSTLMLQAGVPMVEQDFSGADFAAGGLEPFNFYVKFANPGSQFYTWNDSFLNSIDSFAEEKTVMIFNYAHQIQTIREKNPFLKFSIAPLPQPAGAQKAVNFANYWGLAVSNRYPDPALAWNFILAFAADPSAAASYAEKTGRLPAIRSLIAAKINDAVLGVFAKQALSARSWPRIDSSEIDRIFSKMIEDVIAGRAGAEAALKIAESAVSELMARRAGF